MKKMTVLKPFVFRGEMTAVDAEVTPDTQEQADLLVKLGFVGHKRRVYPTRPIAPNVNRNIAPSVTEVMSAGAGPSG